MRIPGSFHCGLCCLSSLVFTPTPGLQLASFTACQLELRASIFARIKQHRPIPFKEVTSEMGLDFSILMFQIHTIYKMKLYLSSNIVIL